MTQLIFLAVALLMSEFALSALADLVFVAKEKERTTGTTFRYYKPRGLGEMGTEFNPKGKPGFGKERGIIIPPIDGEGWCLGIENNRIGDQNAPLMQDNFCDNIVEFYLVQHEESHFFYIIPEGSGFCLGSKDNLDLLRFNKIVQAECIVGNAHQLWWFEESGEDRTVWIHQMSSDLVMYGSRMPDTPVVLRTKFLFGAKVNKLFGLVQQGNTF